MNFSANVSSDDTMVETDGNKLCVKCKYRTQFSAGNHSFTCFYYIRTGKDRACPIGWCNKYEEGEPEIDRGFNYHDPGWNKNKMLEV